MELSVYIETVVQNFSRYHKYSIGSELRDKCRDILYGIYKVYYAVEKKEVLKNLRNSIEEMKIVLYLAKELQALKSFKQYEVSSRLCFELARQAQGWLGSLK